MPIKNKKELFISMLSNIRHSTERSVPIFREFAQASEDPAIKQALEARAYVSENAVHTLDEVFKAIGEKPIKSASRIHDIFVEECKKELADIQSPGAKKLFILTKALHLNHLHVGEYFALVATADLTEHYGVGVLLESCLAEKLAFTERTRRFMRTWLELKAIERLAA